MEFNRALSVSEASELIGSTIREALPALIIEGEVGGFSINKGKFIFFDLKEGESILSCFMMVYAMKHPIEDGMQIRVLAEPVLTTKGRFSLTIREVQPIGEGNLKKSYELLKKKLADEGLLSPERKRRLPEYPKNIGVISSSGAAGWADFKKIINDRWGGLNIKLASVSVQGMSAPSEIINAINYFNQQSSLVDVLVIIRGGGSVDDLSAFSHEGVTRAVASSRIPTLVGIGHETDESLAELVADLRASTPSNAAQLLVPDKREVLASANRVVKVARNGVDAIIEVLSQDRVQAINAIMTKIYSNFELFENKMRLIKQSLAQLSPEATLKRGYALVRSKGNPTTSISGVIIKDEIQVQLKDGIIEAEVKSVTVG